MEGKDEGCQEIKRFVKDIRNEVKEIKTELWETREELTVTKEDLYETKTKLQVTKNELQMTRNELVMNTEMINYLKNPPFAFACGYNGLLSTEQGIIPYDSCLYSSTNVEGAELDTASGVFIAGHQE